MNEIGSFMEISKIKYENCKKKRTAIEAVAVERFSFEGNKTKRYLN